MYNSFKVSLMTTVQIIITVFSYEQNTHNFMKPPPIGKPLMTVFFLDNYGWTEWDTHIYFLFLLKQTILVSFGKLKFKYFTHIGTQAMNHNTNQEFFV